MLPMQAWLWLTVTNLSGSDTLLTITGLLKSPGSWTMSARILVGLLSTCARLLVGGGTKMQIMDAQRWASDRGTLDYLQMDWSGEYESWHYFCSPGRIYWQHKNTTQWKCVADWPRNNYREITQGTYILSRLVKSWFGCTPHCTPTLVTDGIITGNVHTFCELLIKSMVNYFQSKPICSISGMKKALPWN